MKTGCLPPRRGRLPGAGRPGKGTGRRNAEDFRGVSRDAGGV